ncbi:MAG: glycoside hydrolase family 4, partial [Planctomycetes bacterium]|nr:glycoside hydrolase family 4 [Planctomycetota bacterium]
MKGPKVVLIGAASAFFGRQTIWSMVSKEALCGGTLALVDSDGKKLKWVESIARKAIEKKGVPLKLEISTDRREVLKGADFVILAFAREGVKLRGLDAEISTRHGMTMCSADTIGPGGIMRTLREIPQQNLILQDVERLCPEAWVVNWVNPTAAMGVGMMRHFPKLRSLAICDSPHNPRFNDNLIVRAGLVDSAEQITDALRSRVHIRSGGINHFNWLIEMSLGGRDLTGVIKNKLREDNQKVHVASSEEGKVTLANQIACQLADNLGYVPMCVWHTMEYLPYFQGHDLTKKDALSIHPWKEEVRRKWMDECWTDMKNLASGKRDIGDFLEKTTPDHASDIIEAMWAGLPKTFYINTPNGGAVSNMVADAYLELPCVVNMNEVRPLPFGKFPRPLLGFIQRVLDEHELAVEAAVSCDRATLLKAFLTSMVSVSIPDTRACMEEMLKAEKQFL